MKNFFVISSCFLAMVALVSCGKPNNTDVKPVNLIFDTDLGEDFGDVGAIAMLHALADDGDVNILATMSCNRDEDVIPCIEVYNTYYNRPEIPVGVSKDENTPSRKAYQKQSNYLDTIATKYKHATAKSSDAPDAVKLYRQILSKQPDKSVVICTIGFLSNLYHLLMSDADKYSPLSGKELVAKKVKILVSMAGWFPEGGEYNVGLDVPAAITVAKYWPTEIIFSGFEIGLKVFTGKDVIQMPVENNPVKEAFAICMREGEPQGRPSWDQLALLVAVKGTEPWFSTERGIIHINDKAKNTWTADENGTHLRLIQKVTDKELEPIIENYMMHLPVTR
ncbi:inosine-uridine preferring nucleoside hydrolase [Candidatus Symbiothrix dinenymphae]|nr:inosine-uridine preferring nucleoside hydrolase [Candidatus Symbiothrix dinenymphae]